MFLFSNVFIFIVKNILGINLTVLMNFVIKQIKLPVKILINTPLCLLKVKFFFF